MTMLLLLLAVGMNAKTARTFTLNLTDDGGAQMVCFLPETPSGKAIVGVPGGGYSMLSNTHEGTLAAEWMNEQGIAYFVVNYRLPDGDRTKPVGDVEKGIRTVRDSAQAWGINPHDVGIMGFSAGGHLASVISTHSNFDVRPDFSILFYPVISMDERLSHKWSCRNFLGEDGQKDPALVRDFSTQNAGQRLLGKELWSQRAHDAEQGRPALYERDGLARCTGLQARHCHHQTRHQRLKATELAIRQ